ncbi:hypothetical protein ACOI22_03535 [Glaciecola sp. 2405UD65-10]|uniref:hypothetical protein n=1 Tax=Glaciecola sp. 2405UD65-10 TaxID=3397244 RepID=UPI003B598265
MSFKKAFSSKDTASAGLSTLVIAAIGIWLPDDKLKDTLIIFSPLAIYIVLYIGEVTILKLGISSVEERKSEKMKQKLLDEFSEKIERLEEGISNTLVSEVDKEKMRKELGKTVIAKANVNVTAN